MHDPLIVLEDRELLLCEVVRLQRHLKLMCRLRRLLQLFDLSLMDPFHKIKLTIPQARLLSRQRIPPGCLFRILVADDEAVEPVDCLALVPGGLELGRIQAKSVMRAACALLIRSVQKCSRASPTSSYECLVKFGAERVARGVIGVSCEQRI